MDFKQNYCRKRWPDFLFLALISLVVAIFYGRLFAGQMLYLSDVLLYQLPEKMFIRNSLLEGCLPVYNPGVLSGVPMLSNIDAGILYPLNLILLTGSLLDGFHLFVVVHMLLAGWVMYALCRWGLRLSYWPALAGALAYSPGAYLWSMSGNSTYRCAWLIPLFMLGLFWYFRQGNKRIGKAVGFLLSVFSLALLFYCGNFYEAYWTLIFAGTGILFWMVKFYRSHKVKRFDLLLKFLLIVIGGVLLAMPQILPTLLVANDSYRGGGLSLREASHWSFPPLRLVEMFVPYFFGSREGAGLFYGSLYTVDAKFPGCGGSPWADAFFIGFPVLFGAVIYFFYAGKSWLRYFLITVCLWSFLMALGKLTPVYSLFYYILPGFKIFRHPEKFMQWVNFSLILAGACGLEKFRRDLKAVKWIKWLTLISGAVLFVGVVIIIACFLGFPEAYSRYFQEMGSKWNGERIFSWQLTSVLSSLICLVIIFLAVKYFRNRRRMALACLVAVSFFQLLFWSLMIKWTIPVSTFEKVLCWNSKLTDFDHSQWRIFTSSKFYYPPENEEVKGNSLLQMYANLKYNSPILKHLYTVQGFSPVGSRKYREYLDFGKHGASEVLDKLSVRFIAAGIVAPEKLPKGDKIIYQDMGKGFTLIENTNALPRVEFISPKNRVPAEFEDYGAGGILVKTAQPGKIVFHEMFIDGWKCFETKTGKELKVSKSPDGFIEIQANNPGDFKLYYEPPGLKLGTALMFAGLILVLFHFLLILKKSDIFTNNRA
jgi:hypothetical protein